MGHPILCDFCNKPLMPEFKDKGYKVTVKRLKHSYDGYNPWIQKTKLDVCSSCMSLILAAVNPRIEPSPTEPLSEEGKTV